MDSPLFVYGSLKPGELAYFQIEQFVDRFEKAVLHGYEMLIRDSLPLIAKSDDNSSVEGYVIYPKLGAQEKLLEKVRDYEGTSNYFEVTSHISLPNNQETIATFFEGKKISKGHPTTFNGLWTSKNDLILSRSFPALLISIRDFKIEFAEADAHPQAYWNQNNRLLGYYLLLVSILEHFIAIKYGGSGSTDFHRKLDELSQNQTFQNIFQDSNRSN